jgi:hypothetical protein
MGDQRVSEIAMVGPASSRLTGRRGKVENDATSRKHVFPIEQNEPPMRPDDDRFQTDAFDVRLPDVSVRFPPLPPWLASRVLRHREHVEWVYGPWFNPSWERYVTHPLVFLGALALVPIIFGVGWVVNGAWSQELLVLILPAGGIVFGSIFVLGIASGYFTRLVVTNHRLIILQGREVCRSWDMSQLPYSLRRYRMQSDGARMPAIDLDAVKSMLGGASDRVADSKTILSFGKQLDQIRARERDES